MPVATAVAIPSKNGREKCRSICATQQTKKKVLERKKVLPSID